MEIFWLMIWILCGIACAMNADSKGRSFWGWFMLGMLFSFIAVIIIFCLPKIGEAQEKEQLSMGGKKCRFCAEIIKKEAVVCKHCGRGLVSKKTQIKTKTFKPKKVEPDVYSLD